MSVETLHMWGACSSLILYEYDEPCYLDVFKSYLRRELRDEVEDGLGHNTPCENHSFLVVSTNEHTGDHFKKHLRTLGFTETEEQYNPKNETHVQLWTIPIPQLMKNISE